MNTACTVAKAVDGRVCSDDADHVVRCWCQWYLFKEFGKFTQAEKGVDAGTDYVVDRRPEQKSNSCWSTYAYVTREIVHVERV